MATFASNKNAIAICDVCGFKYKHIELKKSSYNTLVCPTCYDGSFDLKNHPQTKPPPVKSEVEAIKDARPDVTLATSTDAGWTIRQTIYIAGQ